MDCSSYGSVDTGCGGGVGIEKGPAVEGSKSDSSSSGQEVLSGGGGACTDESDESRLNKGGPALLDSGGIRPCGWGRCDIGLSGE